MRGQNHIAILTKAVYQKHAAIEVLPIFQRGPKSQAQGGQKGRKVGYRTCPETPCNKSVLCADF